MLQGVCDGGSDDAARCACPSSSCSNASPCPTDAQRGTCAGGPRAGSCCLLELECRDGAPCAGTHKVCSGGKRKAAPCLDDAGCGDSACIASGTACTTGAFAAQPCVDNSDCPSAVCSGPSVAPACSGDCNRSNTVTVDEVILTVNIALGNRPLSECAAADASADNQVTVDEILQGVNMALTGCPAPTLPTQTPRPTRTPV